MCGPSIKNHMSGVMFEKLVNDRNGCIDYSLFHHILGVAFFPFLSVAIRFGGVLLCNL